MEITFHISIKGHSISCGFSEAHRSPHLQECSLHFHKNPLGITYFSPHRYGYIEIK